MIRLPEPADSGSTRPWWTFAVGAAALLLALVGVVSLTSVDGSGDARVQAGSPASPPPTAVVLGVTETAPVPSTTSVSVSAAASIPAVTSNVSPPSVAVTTAATVPTVPVTTPATVIACRNSSDPACGPFRFDPQPGADNPMTVQVVAEPASPRVGQPVVFHVTLKDADGVSHASSTFNFGDSGIGETSPSERCMKFGAWDPPARDTAHATEVQDIRHTYSQAGTYTATFSFEAGPFECVDGATGRGDRPYASSGSGTATVVVRP